MSALIHVMLMFGEPLKMHVSVALEDACREMLLGGCCITGVGTVENETNLPVQLALNETNGCFNYTLSKHVVKLVEINMQQIYSLAPS